jgi:energy-coupling factor transporter ATP-binding protein EcfA2
MAKANLIQKSQWYSDKEEAGDRKIFAPYAVLKSVGAKTLDELEIPKTLRHWHRQVRAGRLGMIFAPRGTGKSTFVLSLALAMVHKKKFLGHTSGGPRRVIILDGEMDLETLQSRARQAAAALDVELDNNLRFVSPELFNGVMPSLSTPEGQVVIDNAIGTEWDVMFIDNYSAFSATGREDAESWAPWIRWMLKHKHKGRTVIILHHSGKNGQQRGSSKHEDALDFVISLKPVLNAPKDGALRFIFAWTKARHMSSDKTKSFVATFAPTPDGGRKWSRCSNAEADPRQKRARELAASGRRQSEIAKELMVDKSTVSRWLASASD